MKNFGIQQSCDENWSKMTPTEKGAFCQHCAKQVIDFTSKSTDYIKSTLLTNKNQSLCGRMTLQQEIDLQTDYALWEQTSHQRMRRISLYAFILVFGLSIVSCADDQDRRTIQQLHQSSMQMLVNDSKKSEITKVQAAEKVTGIQGKVTNIPEPIGCYFPEEIELELVSEVLPDIEEIQTTEELTYVTMGAMVAPNYRHIQYLEETAIVRYDEKGRAIPIEFNSLTFPNPTSDKTTLQFEVPTKTKATIALYDMNGTLVKEIESRKFEPGTHAIPIELRDNLPGTYLIYIVSKEYPESLRIVKVD